MIYEDFVPKKKEILHLIPFFIVVSAALPYYHLQPAEVKKEILHSLLTDRPGSVSIGSVFVYIQVVSYLSWSLAEVIKYRKHIRDQFSSVQKLNLEWLVATLAGYTLVTLIAAVNHFLPRPLSPLMQSLWLTLVIILIFIFMTYILGRALTHPAVFSGISSKKYAGSLLKNRDIDAYKRAVLALMEERKPYKDASLSIDRLSEMMNIPAKSLSQVINGEFGQNFFDFINGYRVREAKHLLTSPRNPKMTVLEVMYEVGFNSKSSFNTVFKKMTGTTPTAFKRQAFKK